MQLTRGDKVVVPGHGLGTVNGLVKTSYGEMVDITLNEGGRYQKPAARLIEDGVRRPASRELLFSALKEIRRPRQKIKGSNWNSQQKNILSDIASGDPISLAKVVRDLYVPEGTEKSYERLQLYNLALRRLGDELAAVMPEVCGTDPGGYLEGIFEAGKQKLG